MEKKTYKSREPDPIEKFSAYAGLGLMLAFPLTLPFIFSNLKSEVENPCFEQKIQKEIIIDSTKVDTTNYQNSINYFDYNKK